MTIQLTDEQVAAIVNKASANATKVSSNTMEGSFNTTKGSFNRVSGRDFLNDRHEKIWTALPGYLRRERRIDQMNNLMLTVLADLRSLQIAARRGCRKEVENRIVAIIDGVENTLAED